eukprot:m.125478 g.125478  ORF g.125478 m.125478 type:complete len:96 (-) comp16654_c0_seq2:336-623(-)
MATLFGMLRLGVGSSRQRSASWLLYCIGIGADLVGLLTVAMGKATQHCQRGSRTMRRRRHLGPLQGPLAEIPQSVVLLRRRATLSALGWHVRVIE